MIDCWSFGTPPTPGCCTRFVAIARRLSTWRWTTRTPCWPPCPRTRRSACGISRTARKLSSTSAWASFLAWNFRPRSGERCASWWPPPWTAPSRSGNTTPPVCSFCKSKKHFLLFRGRGGGREWWKKFIWFCFSQAGRNHNQWKVGGNAGPKNMLHQLQFRYGWRFWRHFFFCQFSFCVPQIFDLILFEGGGGGWNRLLYYPVMFAWL